MSPEAIFLGLFGWTAISSALALLIARAIPASPEPDEHESADVQSEFDWRVAAQVRAINDFHQGASK